MMQVESAVSGAESSARAGAAPEPGRFVRPRPFGERARLGVRWGRFCLKSLLRGDFDFAFNALRAEARLALYWLSDIVAPGRACECNLCGWRGRRFYPNTGPGYDELNTICPGCGCLDRHRALVRLLATETGFFAGGANVIEVAPPRRFQELCVGHPGVDYLSFDIERYAMERGDITQMRYDSDSVDYFLCFHVLEHVPEEAKALAEIRRVLRPGGTLAMQVPVDWSVDRTYEYDKPDPREVGHVRRYGQDVGDRVGSHGFDVRMVRVRDVASDDEIRRFRLGEEPIVFARKPGASDGGAGGS